MFRAKFPARHEDDGDTDFQEAHVLARLNGEVEAIFEVGKPIVGISFVVDERKAAAVQVELLRGALVSRNRDDGTARTITGQQVTRSEREGIKSLLNTERAHK